MVQSNHLSTILGIFLMNIKNFNFKIIFLLNLKRNSLKGMFHVCHNFGRGEKKFAKNKVLCNSWLNLVSMLNS